MRGLELPKIRVVRYPELCSFIREKWSAATGGRQMFPERLLRRRPVSLEDIPGYAGGNLGQQLDWDVNAPHADLHQATLSQSPDRMSGVSSPQNPAPLDVSATRSRMVAPPEPSTVSSTGQLNDAGSIRERTAGPRVVYNDKGRPVDVQGGNDPVAAKLALIQAQEGYKAPRSTKDQLLAFATGGIRGGIDYATDQNTRNRWAVGEDVHREEGQIARDLGIEGKQATVEAAKMRPVYQQAQIDAKAGQQDEREVNDALSQYNRLEAYDPEDPSFTSLKQYFKSRGLSLPKKVKGSNVIADWSDGRLVLTDKTNAQGRVAQVDGQDVTDKGRTPNEKGLTPGQQAGIDTRVSEGQKNREASMARTKLLADAVASRQDKQIAAAVSQLGDPQEMYAAASDIWSQAQEKEKQAQSETDPFIKEQLLSDAAKLKETTVKIQQEARKAAGAGRTKPGRIQPNEDPQIRDYANKHFSGDYKKALAYARSTGYKK